MLIAYNGKIFTNVTKSTNITKLKCSEYPCFRVSEFVAFKKLKSLIEYALS